MTKDITKDMTTTVHQHFVERTKALLFGDSRILGLAIGGSWMTGELDEFSDLDFYVVLDEKAVSMPFEEKRAIVQPLGKLLSFYKNGHDDNVAVSLFYYEPQLLHVDWKWISLSGFEKRVEDPEILFERENCLSEVIGRYPSLGYALPELQYQESRFWTWMHYVLSKLGRGEIIEAYDYLCEVRSYSIGPLVLMKNGLSARRMRFAEKLPENDLEWIKKTIPTDCTALGCIDASLIMMQMFVYLRDALKTDNYISNNEAERACFNYLAYIRHKLYK
jgi:hypothetical protein